MILKFKIHQRELILILIAVLLSGFFNAIMDTIIHHVRNGNPNWIDDLFKYFNLINSEFYVWFTQNDYFGIGGTWKVTLFPFIKDGWHAAKWLCFGFLLSPIWVLLGFKRFVIAWAVWFAGFSIYTFFTG